MEARVGWLLLLTPSIFSIKARVDERHNYLEVESNKFLKFRQDYAELGQLKVIL